MADWAKLHTDNRSFGVVNLVRATWYFLGEHRRAYLSLIVLLVILFFYDFVPAWAVGQIVDILLENQNYQLAIQVAIAIGITNAIVALVRLRTKNAIGNIGVTVQHEVKIHGFARLMDYSITWHQQENTGNKIQKITNGVGKLRDFMISLQRDLLHTLVEIVGVVAIFLTLSWPFTLLIIGYAAFLVANEVYFYRKTMAANNAYNRSMEQSSGAYFEGANNVMTIKSLGAKEHIKKNVANQEFAARDHNFVVRKLGNMKWQTFAVMNSIALAIFLVLVIQQYAAGAITTGTVFVLYTFFGRLNRGSSQIGEYVVNLIEQQSAVGRMMPIFWEGEQVVDGTKPFPKNWDRIAISKGAFSYPSKTRFFALRDISFEIQRGEKVGIVGASGSGKSTLAKIMLGTYKLDGGTFQIGDRAYQDIRHAEVTQNISTVLQETELFNLSLKENLTIFKHVDKEVLAAAIRIAQLEPVIKKLPEGIDTLIGEKGYKLSGGERQRVGIARAICSGAEVLVLDEATSALDSKTEQAIQTALEHELTQKTMVIIAHRLSTLKHVDRILVFDKGRIVEEGTFSGLVKRKSSRFATLYRLQQKAPVK